VPSGSIPFIIGVLATLGINPSLIGIIIGVDRILDMCRTTLNVVGDLTIATYVARSEGHELPMTPRRPRPSQNHAEPTSPPPTDVDSERPWLDGESFGGQ
jgi:Na+/H+-dicarboxylate symporter